MVSTFSPTQEHRSVTLSSAEAEYYALTGAASEALGLQEATRFLTGDLVELKAFTDSSSAIAARQGVGKIKHLAMLWLQQAQKAGRLSVHSVPTARNPADIATKPLASKRILLLMYYLRFFNNGKRVGEEQHQEAQSKELVRRVSKAITKNNNMMQMFRVILASALQRQSEAAAVSHDREEVPQGISSQMNNTLLPQEAMDWRWISRWSVVLPLECSQRWRSSTTTRGRRTREAKMKPWTKSKNLWTTTSKEARFNACVTRALCLESNQNARYFGLLKI